MQNILARASQNIHQLTDSERHALVRFWRDEIQDAMADELHDLIESANGHRKE
jgi:hypothetical protein